MHPACAECVFVRIGTAGSEMTPANTYFDRALHPPPSPLSRHRPSVLDFSWTRVGARFRVISKPYFPERSAYSHEKQLALCTDLNIFDVMSRPEIEA